MSQENTNVSVEKVNTAKATKSAAPSVKMGVMHYQDVGRENCKSATVAFNAENKKDVVSIRGSHPSKFNEVTDKFNVKDCPVYAIKRTRGGKHVDTRYYIVGSRAFNETNENVLSVVKLDGDENVIANLPVFCMTDLARNIYELERDENNKKGVRPSFSYFTVVNFSITEKMRNLPMLDEMKQEMLTTKYEVTIYPLGLEKKELGITNNFGFVFDDKKALNENKAIQFNVQGSQSAMYYLFNKDGDPNMEIINGAAFVEGGNPSVSNLMTRFIDNNFEMDSVAIDISSREMTINLLHKNLAKFERSRTIPFGSYNVFEEMREILKNIITSKRLEIEEIKSMWYNNETVNNEKIGKLTFGHLKYEKPAYAMSEIYDMAAKTIIPKIYKVISTEFKNLRSLMPSANPQFVVLSGGGIFANHGQQSPFLDLATMFVKEFFNPTIKDDKECYAYILPHGLYATQAKPYIYDFNTHKDALSGHVNGSAIQYIKMALKADRKASRR